MIGEKIEYGFKVVSRENLNIFWPTRSVNAKWGSFNDPNTDSIYHKTYPVGEWVHPDKGMGPLALFENIEDAIRMMDYYGCIHLSRDYAIFKCKYIRSKETSLWGPNKIQFSKLPKGAVFAEAIKITERVKI